MQLNTAFQYTFFFCFWTLEDNCLKITLSEKYFFFNILYVFERF